MAGVQLSLEEKHKQHLLLEHTLELQQREMESRKEYLSRLQVHSCGAQCGRAAAPARRTYGGWAARVGGVASWLIKVRQAASRSRPPARPPERSETEPLPVRRR